MPSSEQASRGARRDVAISMLIMVLATVVFSAPALRSDRVLAALDFTTLHDPFGQSDIASDVANFRQGDQAGQLVFPIEFWESARRGEFQFWEPDVGAGTPLGGAIWNRVLSPFNLVTHSWLPPWLAITASVMLSLLVAQLGTWWLARRMGLRPGPASLAAVVYAFSGTSIALLLRIQEVAWFPLVLALVHGTMTSVDRRAIWRIGLGSSVAMLWFCGFPGGALFALVGVVVAAIGISLDLGGRVTEHARRLAVPALAVVAGTLIAAVQLLPTLLFVQVTAGQERVFSAQAYVGITRLADVLTGDFFGSYTDRSFWWSPKLQSSGWLVGRTSGNQVQAGSSIGLMAVVGLLAFVRTRWRRTAARSHAGLVTVAVLLVVTGLSLAYLGGPLLWLLQALPSLDETNPARARFLLIMGLALLAGAGFDALGARVQATPRAVRARTSPALVTAAPGLVLLVLALFLFALGAGLHASAVSGNLGRTGAALLVPGVLGLAVVLLLVARRDRPPLTHHAALVAAVLAAGELLIGMWGHHPTVSRDAVYPRAAVMDGLPSQSQGRFLSTRLGPVYVHSTASLDLPDARTYWPGTLRYEQLLTILDPSIGRRSGPGSVTVGVPTELFDPRHPLVDRLAVRDILVTAGGLPLALSDHAKVAVETRTTAAGFDAMLPAMPEDLGAEAAHWRWLEFLPDRGCDGRRDVVARQSGEQVARYRGEVAADTWFRLALPDLGPGRLSIAVQGCAIDVTSALASLGSRAAFSLVEVDGWQRYTNLGARPMIELVGEVAWIPDHDARLAALEHSGPVIVEDAPPARIGTPAGLSVASIGPDHLDVDVRSADGSTLLVVRENNAPGWQASIDGEVAPIVFVDHAFRGVWVPPGEHRVSLDYVPAGLRWGLVLASVGLLLLWALAASASGVRRGGPRPLQDG